MRTTSLGFRAKLFAVVVLMGLAFVLSAAVGELVAGHSQRQLSELQQRFLPRAALAPALKLDLERISRGLQDSVAAHDPDALAGARSQLAQFERRLRTSEPESLNPRDSAAVKREVEAYEAAGEDVSRRLIAGETGEELVAAMEGMQAKQAQAIASIERVVAVDPGELAKAFAAARRSARTAATYQLWISLSSLIVVSLISLWIGRGLLRSQRELTLGFQRFGEGNFGEPIRVLANDEIGDVARSANRMAESLARSEAELKTANRELEAFSYSVAHDLRAPLRGLHGFSQVLLEDKADQLDAEGKDYLRRIAGNAERMGQLIDALLGLSRVSRTEVTRQLVNLSELADASMKQLRASQPSRHVDFADQAGVVAEGDAQLLRVVFENLLGNAWKFTDGREAAHIEFGAEEKPDGTVYRVRDDGAGFDMAYAGKLFAPFQRLHKASEFPGTGIGLATVQRIVRLHGGQIWAEAAVGQGATFYFTLRDAGGPHP